MKKFQFAREESAIVKLQKNLGVDNASFMTLMYELERESAQNTNASEPDSNALTIGQYNIFRYMYFNEVRISDIVKIYSCSEDVIRDIEERAINRLNALKGILSISVYVPGLGVRVRG